MPDPSDSLHAQLKALLPTLKPEYRLDQIFQKELPRSLYAMDESVPPTIERFLSIPSLPSHFFRDRLASKSEQRQELEREGIACFTDRLEYEMAKAAGIECAFLQAEGSC